MAFSSNLHMSAVYKGEIEGYVVSESRSEVIWSIRCIFKEWIVFLTSEAKQFNKIFLRPKNIGGKAVLYQTFSLFYSMYKNYVTHKGHYGISISMTLWHKAKMQFASIMIIVY